MALTANDFAQQMVAQARVLDPSFSGEIGTPERKLIDTVAQALADNQVDLTGLQSALNIDSKFGANLDRFTALFGMQRQQATQASGYVVFSRPTLATTQIIIPAGVVLQENNTSSDGTPSSVQFVTTQSGSIAVNQNTSAAIPIEAAVAGTVGNVSAGNVQIVGQTPPGVTQANIPNAITNGQNAEDDNSYKVRFKNTWARNLAGTESQYLALALAGTYTSKAVVVGAQSRYQEYIQVPSYDDNGYVGAAQTSTQNTYGTQNQWTTAPSSLPYAKQVYTTAQAYVSNGQKGPAQYFYRPYSDYQFNYPATLTGDALRTQPSTILNGSVTLPTGTINVASTGRPSSGLITQAFPASGTLLLGAGNVVTYTGVTATSFTGCSGGTGTIASGSPVWFLPPATTPNFTFLNVYNPAAGQTPIAGLQALSPQNIVLTEYSYVSSASRNDITHGVTNAIDVYVNGANPMQTSCVLLPHVTTQTFNTNPASPWYYENYRRDGQPTKRPQLSNYFTPLFQPVITSLPSTIIVNGGSGNVTFTEGVDYWLVHETDSLRGSVRSRDGIEWNNQSSPGNNIATASQPASGTTPGANLALEVDNYYFDANIPTLQAAMEANAQINTDVLVHAAHTRYFKLDIAVMYSPNANYATVNAAIQTTVQQFFNNQYFGSIVQLSDLLEIIHEVPGVDNVRWSNDLAVIPDLIRVYETDANGNPLHGASMDRLVHGNSTTVESQTLYVVGAPFGLANVNYTTASGSNPSGSSTLVVNSNVGITPGATLQVGVGSNVDVVTVASISGTGPTWTVTLNTSLSRTHNSGDPIIVAMVDSFTLNWPGVIGGANMTTKPIPLMNPDGTSVAAASIQNAIRAVQASSGIYNNIIVTADTRPSTNVTQPIQSFTVQYQGANGAAVLPTVANTVTSSAYSFDTDFFLKDNQLPSLPTTVQPTGGAVTWLPTSTDTVPGLIIRPRAQNTFGRPGLN